MHAILSRTRKSEFFINDFHHIEALKKEKSILASGEMQGYGIMNFVCYASLISYYSFWYMRQSCKSSG